MYKEILVNTFDSIFKNIDKLTLKILIPTIIISLINFYLPQFIDETFLKNINFLHPNLQQISIPLILTFILVMANISIAVTTHRVVILGVDSVPTLGSFIFGLREFKMLFISILFCIIIAIPIGIVSLIPVIGIFIVPFLAILLTSRLALVFPAIACNEKFGFLSAWRATKEYKLLTIVMVIVFPLLFSFTVGLVYTLAIEFLIKLVSEQLVFLYSILNVFITVFCISALSSVYNYINPRPLNKDLEKNDIKPKKIQTSSRKNSHKVVIDNNHKTDFQSLKKELQEQYKNLGFTEVVYDRKNSWILKNPNNDIAYVSLRYENDEYTILIKDAQEPKLKILKD